MRNIVGWVAFWGTLLILARPATADEVKLWQGSITLPTYEEGPPDPNPPFDSYSTRQFSYPYTLRTNLTGQKKDHVWRALFLENEFLKCTVLPDIGGHIYTCVDKINGQPIFYANPSIKKAQIGYRGAWAAFGVEFNFPVSHDWVSMSPVDFASAVHPDGSASITVANIDRVYGMQWIVELILRPGSTLLEEKVTLYNRSDVRHRYYWWNNAAVQVWDDSRVEYPMRYVASHGFTDVYSWPRGVDGQDLSVIRNQTDGPVSFFVHGSHEPFMGVWNPKTHSGTAHFADYSDLPAKKIWSWGSDADGLNWRKALSDNDSAYVEVQAGLFRNQETYAFLNPGQSIRFSEYWMPVRDTGGISRANQTGVVSFQPNGANIQIALNVNERIKEAKIKLLQGGATLWSETADLSPAQVWSHSVPLAKGAAKIRFELADQQGRMLLKHTDGEFDWDVDSSIEVGHQPNDDIPAPDARSEDDWLKVAGDQELNGKVLLALESYQQALKTYPRSLSLQMPAGRLAASLQHYPEAAELLEAAHKRNTSDAETGYYLGIAEEGMGRLRQAEVAYEIAYRQAEYRARAAARIAQLRATQGDLAEAQTLLQAAVEAAPMDLRAREQLETITRAMGFTTAADQMAREGLAADPTSDILKEETGNPDLPHLAADPYRVLRIATHFMKFGLYRQALAVLERTYPDVPVDQTEPGALLPPNHPIVAYYAAFCREKLGEDARQGWQRAAGLSTNLVFPSSSMDRSVLEAALASNSADGTAHYLLGTLLFSKGLYSDALDHWKKAKILAPTMPVLDADIGNALLHISNNPQLALESFLQGAETDPSNSDVYVGLDEAMSLNGVPAEKRAVALGRYPSTAGNMSSTGMPAHLVYQLALTLAEAGHYDSALGLFKDRFFPSEEGGVSAQQVLFETRLMQAESEAKAGKCREAEAFLADARSVESVNGASAQAHFRMANVASTCKQSEKAVQFLRQAAGGKGAADSAWAVKAKRLLGAGNANDEKKTLEESLVAAERVTETSSLTGWWWYNIGIIQSNLDRAEQARAAFRRALLLPDSMMSHHLSRAGLADLDAHGSAH